MPLGPITVAPSPRPAQNLADYQRNVELWAREVEQALRRFESTVNGMDGGSSSGSADCTSEAALREAADLALAAVDATEATTRAAADTAEAATRAAADTALTTSIAAVLVYNTALLTVTESYYGQRISGLNAGATLAQWDAVHVASNGKWLKSDANTAALFPARGLAVAAGTLDNALSVLVKGIVRHDAWAWTPGGPIYLSTTAGSLTQTAPSASGDCVQVLGYALTATILFLNATPEYIELV